MTQETTIMSPSLKAYFLAVVAALLVAPCLQAAPNRAALLTAKVLASATDGENGNDGGLARWDAVCPGVSGLTREQGEQLLASVSAIAQDGGIPLAGEKCDAKLHIYFTSDPRQLLRGMEKNDRSIFIGERDPGIETTPSKVDAFINSDRVVRAWYNIMDTKSYGSGETPGEDRGLTQRNEEPSRQQNIKHENLLTTFVVVDTTRLAGITQSQIAAYIAMVSLVRINPDVPLGDAQTILRLFEGPRDSAPAGLTVWDRALLKAVYGGNLESKQQSRGLARRIIDVVELH